VKYFSVRILAAIFFMGSIGGGFLTAAEYGKWIGWLAFVALASVGIVLHVFADRIQKA